MLCNSFHRFRMMVSKLKLLASAVQTMFNLVLHRIYNTRIFITHQLVNAY
jgi:hypothetical protein